MQPRTVGLVVGLIALAAGWVFLAATNGRVAPESQPLVETTGFALSTPAGLVFLTYLSSVFEFDAYYGSRSPSALAGDFLLSVLAATAAGLPVAAVVAGITDSSNVLFLASALVTFVAAFAVFAWRTSEFFVAPVDEE